MLLFLQLRAPKLGKHQRKRPSHRVRPHLPPSEPLFSLKYSNSLLPALRYRYLSLDPIAPRDLSKEPNEALQLEWCVRAQGLCR